MPKDVIVDAVNVIMSYAQAQLAQIPGMSIVLNYVRGSYQNDPFRVGLEALLVFFTIRYLLIKPKDRRLELSKKEIDDLVVDWEPEPLVSASVAKEAPENPDAITSEIGPLITTESGKELLNMCSLNYLGLYNSERIKNIAVDTVRSYGVGTCGPAGFYGSLDVHLQLEKDLARVIGTESAIIYAQGFAAVSSVIPAFCKKGDVIVADEQVNMAILKGMQISKSRLYYFKHNDMEDLGRVLQQINDEDRKDKRILTRRFIIVEGLYSKTGEIAKLRNLVAIKERFRYRLLVDETHSFGAIGARGLGLGDYCGVPNTDIDIIVGCMSGALGAAGGFCAGTEAVVDHQRLSSQAYCFSASLPALLARCALESLLEIEARPELAGKLGRNVVLFKSLMNRALEVKGKTFELTGHPDSPLCFLRLAYPLSDRKFEESLISGICKEARSLGLAVFMPALIEKLEKLENRPAIKILISGGLQQAQMERAVEIIVKCITDCKLCNY